MNGKKARAARKAVYGDEKSFRARTYSKQHGTIIADGDRRLYQDYKKGRDVGMKIMNCVLKNYYLKPIREQINSEKPLFGRLDKA